MLFQYDISKAWFHHTSSYYNIVVISASKYSFTKTVSVHSPPYKERSSDRSLSSLPSSLNSMEDFRAGRRTKSCRSFLEYSSDYLHGDWAYVCLLDSWTHWLLQIFQCWEGQKKKGSHMTVSHDAICLDLGMLVSVYWPLVMVVWCFYLELMDPQWPETFIWSSVHQGFIFSIYSVYLRTLLLT